jgi:hypothetical protein
MFDRRQAMVGGLAGLGGFGFAGAGMEQLHAKTYSGVKHQNDKKVMRKWESGKQSMMVEDISMPPDMAARIEHNVRHLIEEAGLGKAEDRYKNKLVNDVLKAASQNWAHLAHKAQMLLCEITIPDDGEFQVEERALQLLEYVGASKGLEDKMTEYVKEYLKMEFEATKYGMPPLMQIEELPPAQAAAMRAKLAAAGIPV